MVLAVELKVEDTRDRAAVRQREQRSHGVTTGGGGGLATQLP